MVQLPPLNLALPAIKLAVEQGLLQAQTLNGSVAQYQGPCAIGIILPPETQALLDYGSSEGAYGIASFFDTNAACVSGDDNQDDWIEIQRVHDRWYGLTRAGSVDRANELRTEFLALIDKLMLKYPLFPSQK